MSGVLSNIRNVALLISVMVLFPLSLSVGYRIVSPQPKPEDHMVANSEAKESWFAKAPQQDAGAYQQVCNSRAKSYFFTMFTAGIIAIALAGVIQTLSLLGVAALLSGLMAVLCGYTSAWTVLPDWLILVSLLLALIVVTWVAYRRCVRDARS